MHEAERQLKDNGDKVDAATRSEIESAIATARSAAEGEDVAQIEAATQTLTDALHKMSEEIYRQASAQPSPDGASGAPGEETVEDAEYEIVDDEPSSHA